VRFDDITWLILGALQQDARLSYKQLAERVGLTPPAVADRLRKLERAGVIERYEVRLNADKLGLPITAVIRMNATGEAGRQLDAAVSDIPEILECHRVTGAESHVIRARVASTTHLENLLTTLGDYGTTVTNIVTSSAVPRRGLALPPVAH
jgi:Lrp/AsnC family leucine-responsive transcriptional regulator